MHLTQVMNKDNGKEKDIIGKGQKFSMFSDHKKK